MLNSLKDKPGFNACSTPDTMVGADDHSGEQNRADPAPLGDLAAQAGRWAQCSELSQHTRSPSCPVLPPVSTAQHFSAHDPLKSTGSLPKSPASNTH